MIVYVLWLIIVICVFGIGRILWRHLPLVTRLRTETLSVTPDQVKKKMLAKRLERKLGTLGSWSKATIWPNLGSFKKTFQNLLSSIMNLEEQYRRRLFSQKF
ncbi:MAG: hypothetical protein NTV81_02020, partial [Candidatus Komeilibacteria bacterium]|nr:hypothetical protein [Candidatus Komeilibacteria bacterium]